MLITRCSAAQPFCRADVTVSLKIHYKIFNCDLIFVGEGFVKAVVLNTGFLTSKGELVRSIMYPPPADFKFDQDSYKFIGILAVIALLGFIYTVVSKVSKKIKIYKAINVVIPLQIKQMIVSYIVSIYSYLEM